MSLSSWWRKRQGILKEEPIPIYQNWLSADGYHGVVLSSLLVESVCERFRKSFPSPDAFVWCMHQMSKAESRGFYHYHFKLKEKKDGYQNCRYITEM